MFADYKSDELKINNEIKNYQSRIRRERAKKKELLKKKQHERLIQSRKYDASN